MSGLCRIGVGWLLLAWFAPLPPAAAQVPPPSRDELLRKWDLDRNGKIDASETEIARSRMRRDRSELLLKSGVDPLTGRPRAASDPSTGRPATSQADADAVPEGRGGPARPADEGGLILVPGTGEPAPGAAPLPALTPRIPTGDPGAARPVPAGRPDTVGDRGSRGVAPGRTPVQAPQLNPTARDPRPRGAVQEPQPTGGERPGIIAGGVRAGGPAARPGYGAAGPVGDLNAGRQQASGLPPPGTGRTAGAREAMRGPGLGTARGPATQSFPSTGVPAGQRPMLRQPDGAPPATRQPGIAPRQSGVVPRQPGMPPRAPRVSVDDFQGR